MLQELVWNHVNLLMSIVVLILNFMWWNCQLRFSVMIVISNFFQMMLILSYY